MKKYILNITLLLIFAIVFSNTFAQETPTWNVDLGARWFKYSTDWKPNEIQFNAVFDRWERINQNFIDYSVSEYEVLQSLYFNMNFGVDLFIRYKKYLLIKIGYDYSNSLGIGGEGNISYTDKSTGKEFTERKEFGYTSHQINYFIGPLVPIGESGSEIYLGFCIMPPTWVTYKEKYSKTEDGEVVVNYDKTFTGFFGSCRALVGIQIPVSEKLKLGSEAVFTFVNYMKLESDNLTDYSFRFPNMKWNITIRYALF
jgi:hypothetical protein